MPGRNTFPGSASRSSRRRTSIKSELKAAHVHFDALKNARDQYRFDSVSDLNTKQGLVALTAPAADVPKWEGSYQRTLRLAIPGETPMSISLSPSGRAR